MADNNIIISQNQKDFWRKINFQFFVTVAVVIFQWWRWL